MTQALSAKNIVRIGSIFLFFLVIVGYGLWSSRELLFGIRMSVSGISNGEAFTSSPISLSGKATRAISLSVDGENISLAQDGTWQDAFALSSGYNPIVISATDKFGKTVTKEFEVYYQASPPAPTAIQ